MELEATSINIQISLCMNHWQVSSIASDRHQSQRANTFQMGDMTHHHQHAMRNGMSMERKMDAPVSGHQLKFITSLSSHFPPFPFHSMVA